MSYFGAPKKFLNDNERWNLIMKATDRWLKSSILKHALQLWRVHNGTDNGWNNGKDIRRWEMRARNSPGLGC